MESHHASGDTDAGRSYNDRPPAQREHAEVFEAHRSLLLGLAYRLLGSMWDAEDVAQDAYLRWLRV